MSSNGRKDSIVINPHNARHAAAQRERNLQGLPKNQSYEENSRRLDENLIGNPEFSSIVQAAVSATVATLRLQQLSKTFDETGRGGQRFDQQNNLNRRRDNRVGGRGREDSLGDRRNNIRRRADNNERQYYRHDERNNYNGENNFYRNRNNRINDERRQNYRRYNQDERRTYNNYRRRENDQFFYERNRRYMPYHRR